MQRHHPWFPFCFLDARLPQAMAVCRLIVIALIPAISGAASAADESGASSGNPPCTARQQARQTADAFLALVDNARYAEAWQSASAQYQARQDKAAWLDLANDLLRTAGKPQQRNELTFHLSKTSSGSPTAAAVFDDEAILPNGTRYTTRIAVGETPSGQCGVVAFQPDIRRLILGRLLDNFVDNVNRTGGRLDYSRNSLIEIERLLMEQAPGGHPRSRLGKESDYRAVIHLLGYYLGEVVVRHENARWSHTPAPGSETLPKVILPSGQAFDAFRIVSDYAVKPSIGALRQTIDEQLGRP